MPTNCDHPLPHFSPLFSLASYLPFFSLLACQVPFRLPACASWTFPLLSRSLHPRGQGLSASWGDGKGGCIYCLGASSPPQVHPGGSPESSSENGGSKGLRSPSS